MTGADGYLPDPAYLALSDGRVEHGAPFFDVVEPAKFPKSIVRYRNDRWAARVGLAGLEDDAWAAHFARFEPLPDNLPAPLAVRYHGHQFRNYNPDIGDGRGFLFAQLHDDAGRLLDLATKGSGRTPYSRTADGRLTLKGAVREILATELLEARGVYTSKTFSVIETGEELDRHDEPSPTRSAVLTRLGHSHVRFGVFQRLGFEGDRTAILKLIDYCIANFYPDLADADDRPTALFSRVVARTARLVAQWTAAGFVHGVLNTDNMNVTGESFDYGPWRFLPNMDMAFTAAYFDETGLYAFGRQPEAAAWNLSRLGGVFALIGDENALNGALEGFSSAFEREMARAFFARLGLKPRRDDDYGFVMALIKWMASEEVPFERVFFDWFCGNAARAEQGPLASAYRDASFEEVRTRLTAYTPDRPERLHNAYFDGAPCDMLIDEVEDLWSAIADREDWTLLARKLVAIAGAREAYDLDASRFDADPT